MVIKQFAGKWKFRWFYFWLLYSLFYSSTEIISKYSIHHAQSNLITTQEHHRLLVMIDPPNDVYIMGTYWNKF